MTSELAAILAHWIFWHYGAIEHTKTFHVIPHCAVNVVVFVFKPLYTKWLQEVACLERRRHHVSRWQSQTAVEAGHCIWLINHAAVPSRTSQNRKQATMFCNLSKYSADNFNKQCICNIWSNNSFPWPYPQKQITALSESHKIFKTPSNSPVSSHFAKIFMCTTKLSPAQTVPQYNTIPSVVTLSLN